MPTPSTNRPNTTDPYHCPALVHLRGRGAAGDYMNQGPDTQGQRTVWYKVNLQDVAGLERKAHSVLDAVAACFKSAGLQPEKHLLIGANDQRLTLSFSFPYSQARLVNDTVMKINNASRAQEAIRKAASAQQI